MKWLVSDMSMHIKIHDNTDSTTHYYGTVFQDVLDLTAPKNVKVVEYEFVAIVNYHSDPECVETNIEWVDEPVDNHKAVGRITKLVGRMWEDSRVFDKVKFGQE